VLLKLTPRRAVAALSVHQLDEVVVEADGTAGHHEAVMGQLLAEHGLHLLLEGQRLALRQRLEVQLPAVELLADGGLSRVELLPRHQAMLWEVEVRPPRRVRGRGEQPATMGSDALELSGGVAPEAVAAALGEELVPGVPQGLADGGAQAHLLVAAEQGIEHMGVGVGGELHELREPVHAPLQLASRHHLLLRLGEVLGEHGDPSHVVDLVEGAAKSVEPRGRRDGEALHVDVAVVRVEAIGPGASDGQQVGVGTQVEHDGLRGGPIP
jgi:hypothetical protein